MRIITAASLLLYINFASASRSKRTDIEFNSDTDVEKYLENRGRDMSIFKCKKVVMVQWLHSVIPYVDLECQVLGDVMEVTWYVNDTLIDTLKSGGRHISLSQPHYRKRVFYNTWFDYKLRMLHVTEDDNGPYTMKIRSPLGHEEERDIMLEVITEYTDDKWTGWMTKIEKDRNQRKNKKRSAAKAAKLRRKELMRAIRKRAHDRKNQREKVKNPLIFDGE